MTLWLNIQTLSRMTIPIQEKTVGCLHQSMSSDGLTLNVRLTTHLFANLVHATLRSRLLANIDEMTS
ncbi:hypothetical protein DPMN_080948 [Dreissena polymorpha]|uniref:Uncharacterized protein n=1 Tax=Dreissena polymorpha TaxID=45954 RepID=A0A9D3Y577_DREPO|nr:hypothetical protein DPMN_080948 [Dreissena polymorpha]